MTTRNVSEGETEKSKLFNSKSIWGSGLFSGISSKIEAAFQSNFNESQKEGNYEDETLNGDATLGLKQGDPVFHSHTSRKSKVLANKQRAIFGQPEVNLPCTLHKSKDKSMDSLDTYDSGHSLGGSSNVSVNELRYLDLHDALRPFLNAESSGVGSEQSTSLESSDVEESATEELSAASKRSESRESLQSSISDSSDSQLDDHLCNVKRFIKQFVHKIFAESSSITLEEKSAFGEYCRTEYGRLWFARYISKQRIYHKEVSESTFYSLVQYFAIVLFECADADDFAPAKIIMNMSFTYYYKPKRSSSEKHYLYQFLREQPIWRSLRFWSAAFFDAVQYERAKRPPLTRDDLEHITASDVQEETTFQQNLAFGQLGTFTYNMKEFGLPKKLCLDFLRKQSTIANLPQEQLNLLYQNIDNMYR